MTENGSPRFQPAPPPAPLEPALRVAFLRAVQFFEPRLWIVLNAEVDAAKQAGIDPAIALLALASGLIDLANGAMEVRQALAAAGGDADVAAMILGIRSSVRVESEPEAEADGPVSPKVRTPRRRRGMTG